MTNLRDTWSHFRAYRRTLAELRSLSPRQLRDLDIDRTAIDAAARRAVYGR